MPAVFVHGVPETAALWDGVRSRLQRDDTVALSLPGFGTARPDGFDATKERYVEWLVGELEEIGEPVDLVGHDFGGAFAIRAADLRPDLLRSWVSDALYVFDPRYRWHRYAVRWQTPEVGEADVEDTLTRDLDEQADTYVRWGLPAEDARRLVSWFDPAMGAAILDLYRSAVGLSEEWGPDLELDVPGLALHPDRDPFAPSELVAAVARRQDVAVEILDGLGHWWMLQAPDRAAAVLERFWERQDQETSRAP